MSKYDDIINLSRPKSKYPHISDASRAAQFSPFAALIGYDEQIKETARITDKRIYIDDDLIEILNNKLNYIDQNIKSNPAVVITFFVEDTKKDGGKYITKEIVIKKIDKINQLIICKDGYKIHITDIIDISSPIFNKLDSYFQ